MGRDSDNMRVHRAFKRYISDVSKETDIPQVKITERLADMKPLIPVKKVKL